MSKTHHSQRRSDQVDTEGNHHWFYNSTREDGENHQRLVKPQKKCPVCVCACACYFLEEERIQKTE